MTDNVEQTLGRIGIKADGVSGKMIKFQDQLSKIDGGKIGKNIGWQINSVSGMLGNGGDAVSSFTESLMGSTSVMGALGAGFVAAGAYGAKAALSLEQSFAKVNATAQLTGRDFEDLKGKITSIAESNSADVNESALAYERILGQTNDVYKSYEILNASLKGAKAGFASNEVVADALAKSLSAISDEGVSAIDVLDTLFASKKYGAGDFADFANYIPGLISGGKNVGLDYKEVSALYSYMTAMGNGASQSDMLLNNFMSQLGKTKVTDGLTKLGVKVFDTKGKFEAVDKILIQLHDKVKGLSDKQWGSLLETIGIQDIQAKEAFSALISNTGKLSESFKGVNDSANETKAQLDITKNKLRTLEELGTDVKNYLTNFGTHLINPHTWFPKYQSEQQQGENKLAFYRNLKEQQDARSGKTAWWSLGVEQTFDNTVDKQISALLYRTSQAAKGANAVEELGLLGNSFDFRQKENKPFSFLLPPKIKPPSFKNTDKSLDSKFDAIHGGGSQQRNVYVTVHRIMDGDVKIYPTTVTEGMDNVGEQVKEGLLKIINGAEQSLMTN